MDSWIRPVSTVVAATLVVTVGASPPANAHEAHDSSIMGLPGFEYHIPDIAIEVYGHVMDASQLETYQAMAEEDGVSVAEIVEKYHWQSEFGRVVTELADTHPGEFAGAAVTGNSTAGWIAFAGEPPVDAFTLAARLPKPVQIVGFKGFSEDELAQQLKSVYYAVAEHPLIVEAHGSMDIETGRITVTAQPIAGLSPNTYDNLLTELQPSPATNSSILVEVRLGHVEATLFNHYRGGAHAFMNHFGAWCTWGFNVIPNEGGGHGLTIARHCAPNTGDLTARYHQHGSGSSGTLTRVRHGIIQDGDMAFYRTSGHLVDGGRFYSNTNQTSVVTQVARPFSGLRLCSYGRTTARQCDNEVWRLGECSSNFCELAMTHRNRQDHGDSGGPWYSGGTAYGITHGAKSVLFIQRGLFTPVSPNFEKLQVRVRTG